jgi:hypothetical protein
MPTKELVDSVTHPPAPVPSAQPIVSAIGKSTTSARTPATVVVPTRSPLLTLVKASSTAGSRIGFGVDLSMLAGLYAREFDDGQLGGISE